MMALISTVRTEKARWFFMEEGLHFLKRENRYLAANDVFDVYGRLYDKWRIVPKLGAIPGVVIFNQQ